MRKLIAFGAALSLVVIATGCVEREVVVEHPRQCASGVWVEGHYGPHGRWHHGHCRAPGAVEVIEVD